MLLGQTDQLTAQIGHLTTRIEELTAAARTILVIIWHLLASRTARLC